jgi:DNA-binding transcriptional LysR family regulator
MELLQLHYFLLLAKVQHVTRTAELLHISQPALSATIKKLEAELGAPLFVRKGRNIALSPYGEVFQRHAEEAFLSLENGKQAIANLQKDDHSTLSVGLLSPYIWNDLFHCFHHLHPEIQLNRSSIETDRFEEAILSGEIDFYLGGLNRIQQLDTSQLQYAELYQDRMVLLVHEKHPLAGRQTVDLRECAGEPFIHLNPEANLQQFIDQLFWQAGFSPKVVMTCDYTLRDHIVAEGHGVSITTQLGAQKSEVSGVVAIPIAFPTEKRRLGLVWRKKRVFSNAMAQFYQVASGFYLQESGETAPDCQGTPTVIE